MEGLTSVTLDNVTKRFGGVVALRNLNLEVKDREFFVLVGPNGCGKTTLLRLIAGVIKPDSGNIYIDNIPVNDLKPAQRGVRMVFQSYALYPHMKIFDERRYSNLNFALKVRKYMSDKIRNIVRDVSENVGIDRRLFRRKPHELSHGEQQKVAVGRAITIPPKVFLMDEPLSNIDPPSRIQIIKEIRRVHEELQTTTIYVTHNLAEAMAIADRLAIMREGSIEQVGTPSQVRDNPINEFVADFVEYYDYTAHLRSLKD